MGSEVLADPGLRDRNLRVLLVEDSRFDAELLIESLQRSYPRAKVDLVADEESFVRALRAGGPDVILSDFELPGFSGARALDLAKVVAPRIPFIFVSGVIGEENAVELMKRGATDYVGKGRLTRLPLVLERALLEAGEKESREAAESRLQEASSAFARVNKQRLALIELSDRIREVDEPHAIGHIAAEMLGRELEVDRAGYGVVSKLEEIIRIERDWSRPGVASLAGVLRFRDYGSYIEDLKQGLIVAFADAREDDRTRDEAAALEAINARSVVNLPLTEEGDLVGLLYLNHGLPRAWSPAEIEFIREVGDRVRVAIGRREAQEKLSALALSLEQQVEARTRERDQTWALSHDLLGVMSTDGIIQSVNPAWTSVLGWSQGTLQGSAYTTLIHPDDLEATVDRVGSVPDGGAGVRFVSRMRGKAGDYRSLAWTVVRHQDSLFTTARDITDELARAGELEAAREQPRQSQKLEAVGQLTGGLAHDFNNLLAAISGSLELVSRRCQEGRYAELERFIQTASGASKRAAALTHRLLAFSRQQTLQPKAINVNRLIADMHDLIARTLGPSITLEVVGGGGLWSVEVDPNQLENTLLNLCINARDAMPDGGRLVIETSNRWMDTRTAAAREMPAGQYISMCVSDNGVGMSAEVVARAFDPFFTTKPIGMGTGLGLSMIYGFAKQSGGHARIYSEVGQGTMVCVYLPRHVGEPSQPEEPSHTEQAPEAERGQTVLVVDDEAALRMVIIEVMNELGYTTLEAADGAEALRHLQSGSRIDVLVSDVGLPGGMNGRQVAEAARALRPGLTVLFITGYAENAVLSHGRLDPGMHVLTKPFELNVLARRVKELMDANRE